jgi:hypothetical protein
MPPGDILVHAGDYTLYGGKQVYNGCASQTPDALEDFNS